MFLKGSCIDNYVVHVNKKFVSLQSHKNVIHKSLKYSGRVFKSERHTFELIMSIRDRECRFWRVFWIHLMESGS